MRHNILIVDDEQLIRQGLRARIEYLGIDVDEITIKATTTEKLGFEGREEGVSAYVTVLIIKL